MTISPQQLSCDQVGDVTIYDVVEEHDEAGSRKPAKLLDPQLPTKAEIEEHNLTHLPSAIGARIACVERAVLQVIGRIFAMMVCMRSIWTIASLVRREATRRPCL